jgi:hypothetical protein
VAVADRVGLIWQGRYSIATLMGLVTFALASADHVGRSVLWRLAVVTSLGELAAYWLTVRRFTVGDRGSWWFDAAASGRWDPPVEPLALLAVHAGVLAAALAARYLMYPKRSMTTSVLPW